MKTNKHRASNFLAALAAAVLTTAAQPACAGGQVPFHGGAEGATTGATPDPEGVVLTVLAEGYATQLGHFSRDEVVLFNPVTGSLSGDVVFTAANGDQLFGTLEGGFVSPTTATGSYTFTGGTGRFAKASGTADFVVSTPDGVHVTVEFDGDLSSVGSNKKQ